MFLFSVVMDVLITNIKIKPLQKPFKKPAGLAFDNQRQHKIFRFLRMR
jgi:hypothetical protein